METNGRRRRVAVTGLGAITPLGVGVEAYWDGLIHGRSGAGRIDRFDVSSYTTQIAALVPAYDPNEWVPRAEARRMDQFVLFAAVASEMAIRDAKLDLAAVNLDRAGVIIGSGIGGLQTLETEKEHLLEKGPRRVSPFLIPMMIVNMASGMIAMRYRFRGPNTSSVTACATGNHSLGEAFRAIERGYADLMLAGGTEAAVTPLGLAGFCALRALSTRNDEPTRASRPFDAERDGFVMGEGAGVLLLEELEHAKARGARIYAELVGFGMTCDAYHLTQPLEDGSGISRAMELALADAGIGPTDVDYVNAHGTSTPYNDKAETVALRNTFGAHARSGLVVSSTKSMTGHLLGAAGGIEMVATVKALAEGIIPPTINYEHPDPDCDLDYCPNQARQKPIRYAISNSMGFGGHNAVLVAHRYDE